MKKKNISRKNVSKNTRNINDVKKENTLNIIEKWYLPNLVNHIQFFEEYILLKRKNDKININVEVEYKRRIAEIISLMQKEKDLLQLINNSWLAERFSAVMNSDEIKGDMYEYFKKKVLSVFSRNFKNNISNLGNNEKEKLKIIIIDNKSGKRKRIIPENISPKLFTWTGTRNQLKRLFKISIDKDLFDLEEDVSVDKIIDSHFVVLNEKRKNKIEDVEEKIRWKHPNISLLVYFFYSLMYDYELLSISHEYNMHKVIADNFLMRNGKDLKARSLSALKSNYLNNTTTGGRPLEWDKVDAVLSIFPQKK